MPAITPIRATTVPAHTDQHSSTLPKLRAQLAVGVLLGGDEHVDISAVHAVLQAVDALALEGTHQLRPGQGVPFDDSLQRLRAQHDADQYTDLLRQENVSTLALTQIVAVLLTWLPVLNAYQHPTGVGERYYMQISKIMQGPSLV